MRDELEVINLIGLHPIFVYSALSGLEIQILHIHKFCMAHSFLLKAHSAIVRGSLFMANKLIAQGSLLPIKIQQPIRDI